MIDDLGPARPQSGFNAASVVWQAPAEGGIPRYMMIFQLTIPACVGPVRSSRYYYIAWAAEWKALYAHAGGSPQALATLQPEGQRPARLQRRPVPLGQSYFWRIKERFAPHNLYTDGKHLRQLATKVGAKDGPVKPPWQFAPDAPLEARPLGGTIVVTYPQNKITYAYDRTTNTYLRSVTGEKKQIDKADGKRVAPEERRDHDHDLRAAQRRPSQQAPPRGERRRHRQGLDRDERQDDQGHVEQEVEHGADPVLRRGRQAGRR